jgi:hypothetical protein
MGDRNPAARLQSLEDAIVAATQALGEIADYEKVEQVHFGQFDTSVGGGWYWSIDVSAHRELGNTKRALAQQRPSWRDHNSRAIVRAGLAAQLDHTDLLGESIARDRPQRVVTEGEAGSAGNCPHCPRAFGQPHRDDCPLAEGDR